MKQIGSFVYESFMFTGEGGHIGCAESFNANLYGDLKMYCEELHSLLDKVSKTLRMKSYDNFMIW